jgi:predicted Rossmann fold flavoprotein
MFDCVVIGGGPAGFFGAISLKQEDPSCSVLIVEKTEKLLSKVRISGGGRCNVTHSCFDVRTLCGNYPRGSQELISCFHTFQPRDMIAWLEQEGVLLKTEDDGRMFPVTDSSQTIIDALMQAADRFGIEIRTSHNVHDVEKIEGGFRLQIDDKPPIDTRTVLAATGSVRKMYDLLEKLGHTVVPLVPSLFTFNVPTSPLLDLSGIAVDPVRIELFDMQQDGPLLLTHWGFSGPAVLKLSAWGARKLFEQNYKATCSIYWLHPLTLDQIKQRLIETKEKEPNKQIGVFCPFSFPKNLWKRFLQILLISEERRYADISKKEIQTLSEKLYKDPYPIDGKTTYKYEFVTAGGVHLKEIDFKTMQSKKIPGLYFAGEVLNIDGITGGFNFQNCWTGGFIAGRAIAQVLRHG